MSEVTRRDFVKSSAAVSAGAAVGIGALKNSTAAWAGANDKLKVAVLGIRGRGKSHLNGFMDQENVEVATICDIDENLFEDRLKEFFDDRSLKRPKVETDLRNVMEDKDIDIVSVATPNHWHSLAAIWAIQAGKDCYVEKPISHNVFEGRRLSDIAAETGRVVQHGTQIRSSEAIREAVQKLNEGVIGDVYMARGLCYRWRPTIGTTPVSEVPKGVHYDTWLGPAPESPFSENRFHYNWHYMWDYGNGDIGNQGVHQLDVARWGLGVKLPTRVTSASGMFIYEDDKEVPNTITTSYEYPNDGPHGKMLVFDTRPYYTNDEKGAKVGILFYGSEGYMVIDSYSHYQTYLGKDEEEGPGRSAGGDHYKNFVDAVRAKDPSMVHASPEDGHLSAALAHIGIASAKLGRSLEFDPEREKFVGDAEANQLITRVYRKPFVVPGGASSADGRMSNGYASAGSNRWSTSG